MIVTLSFTVTRASCLVGETITERHGEIRQRRNDREEFQQCTFAQIRRRDIQFGQLRGRPISSQHVLVLKGYTTRKRREEIQVLVVDQLSASLLLRKSTKFLFFSRSPVFCNNKHRSFRHRLMRFLKHLPAKRIQKFKATHSRCIQPDAMASMWLSSMKHTP